MNNNWNLYNTYTSLPNKFYSRLGNANFPNPRFIIINKLLCENLGLNPDILESEADALVGNRTIGDSLPIAQAYCGHQFGYFTMLGDGRAKLIGEQVTPSGEIYDIQLKGSGQTIYSRGGDGKAVLSPMLREYIISWAMDKLGIPTTKSLAVLTTGESVFRNKMLPGAVLVRVAKSHIRVGTFQFAAMGQVEDLKAMADYTIQRHYPEIDQEFTGRDKYRELLRRVVNVQASLIAEWMSVGFIHGVMNTDNMSISGETIDYGPCAFMDTYDPMTVFSSIDKNGRYAYGNQPVIGQWNLSRLADALIPLLDEDEEKAIQIAKEEIIKYSPEYKGRWLTKIKRKLGLFKNNSPSPKILIEDLLHLMEYKKADYNNTFLRLTLELEEKVYGHSKFAKPSMIKGTESLFNSTEYKLWKDMWYKLLEEQEGNLEESLKIMKENNPVIIPRNHVVEYVLEKAQEENNMNPLFDLLQALSKPYDYESQLTWYNEPAPSSSVEYKTYCGT